MGDGGEGGAHFRYTTSSSSNKAVGVTLPPFLPSRAQAAPEPRITARAGPRHHAGGLHRKGASGVRSQIPPPASTRSEPTGPGEIQAGAGVHEGHGRTQSQPNSAAEPCDL